MGGMERAKRRRGLLGALALAALLVAGSWRAGRPFASPEPTLDLLRGRTPAGEYLDVPSWDRVERLRSFPIDRDRASVLAELRRDLGSRGVESKFGGWHWEGAPDDRQGEWSVSLDPAELPGSPGRCVVGVYGARTRADGYTILQWLRTRLHIP